MNEQMHQPFSDWLLADEPLTVEQSRHMQDHLRSCEICRQRHQAWNGVQHLFRSSGQITPTPGFAFRWQVRLVTQRLERQRRMAWVFFVVLASLSAGLLGLMAWQLVAALAGPQQIIAALMLSITSAANLARGFFQAIGRIGVVLPPFSLLGLFFFAGFVSMLSVLWLVVYRQLTMRKAEIYE